MKKRILAMLLTVCMLVLAVPVFVIPTTAAEEPAYTTSWTDNIPEASAFVQNATSVEWVGNWNFVAYNRWQTPGVDVPQGQNGNLWVGPAADTGWAGFVTLGGKYLGMNWGNADKDNHGSIGSILPGSRTCDESVNSQGGTAGIRYTAEKAGVLNIYFDKLGNDATNVEGNFTYYLYVNGEKVQTWTLAKTAGEEAWIYTAKTLIAEDITVRKGTVIEFLCDTDIPGTNDAYNRGGNCLFPTIEYTETEDGYETKFNSSTNVPTWENGAVVFHGNWSYWQYQKENNNGAGYYNTDWRYKVVTQQSSVPVAGYIASQWFSGAWGAGMQISNSHANQAPALGSMSVSSALSSVLRYTAEKSGNIDILIDQIGVMSGHADFSHNNVRFGIFVNGTMVWPVAGGTLREVPALSAKMLYNIEAVNGLYVSQGDRIEFIVEGYKQNLNNSWGGAGNIFFPTITFKGLGENVKSFDSATNLPVINEDKTIDFNGNFYGVGYLKGENGFDYTDPTKAILMDQVNSALWTAGDGRNGIAAKPADLGWSSAASMVINNFNGNYFNQKGQICVTGKMAGAVRYVAEETGIVKLDFAMLGNTAPLSAGIKKFDYFVYVNGEKVWETDGATWTTSTKSNIAIADAIELNYGDVVDFIVEGEVGDTDLWGGAGNVICPVITWTKIIPKPTTLVNVAMNSSFALNAKVEIPVSVLADVDEVGFLVNGEEVEMLQTDINKYVINNILKAYVQDLASDEVTIQAYYTTISGKTIYGTEITTNIIDVIQAYVNGADKAASDLAKATLNYIAEAQLYFDPTLSADDLANAILADEDMLDFEALDFNRYDDTVIVENEDATVEFGGVSMILNSATALKFYFELPEGADIEDYAFVAMDPVTMSSAANPIALPTYVPAGAMIAPLKYTENGSAIAYFGSTFENMDRLYAFAVVDMANGEVVSDLLVYSPLAYAATMAEDLEVGYVCASLIALNDAIDVYTGAVATR